MGWRGGGTVGVPAASCLRFVVRDGGAERDRMVGLESYEEVRGGLAEADRMVGLVPADR